MHSTLLEESRERPGFSHGPVMDQFLLSIHRAGETIKSLDRTAVIKSGEGHRSVVSQDKVSQSIILKDFLAHTHVRFVSEEASDAPRILSQKNPELIFQGTTIVMDPLDGRTLYSSNMPEWCVGGGLMEDGKVVGSAAYAPDANGGMLFYSHKDRGMWLSQGGDYPRQQANGHERRDEHSWVLLRGVDTERYSTITRMIPGIAPRVRAVYTIGSGIFGLMSVALGRVTAIIQTPQKIWDWLPMHHAMKTAGKVFHFFRLKDGTLIEVDGFDMDAFRADHDSRLGFVAGEKMAANHLFAALPRSGWGKSDPDMG